MNKIQLSSLKTELYNLAIGLGIKVPDDHPHRRLFLRLEREAQGKIETALDKMRRDLFRGVNRSNAREILQRVQSREINEQLRLALFDALKPVVLAGTGEAQKQIERDVLGVKAAPIFEIGFNWEMVNTDALAWLQDYTFELISGLTDTNTTRLRTAIDGFIQSPDMTMNQLSEQVANLFNPVRANMIAITEVTRTFAQANIEAWRSTGVIERKRWNTANDELVCPICGPLNGQVAGMDESFNGIYDSPPAHPRCRCWVTPVVEAPTELDIINQEMEAILNEPGFDSFADIRPPAGRAPRGMGQEYADRRAIVSRIQTQMRYRSELQSYINNYRGQRNQRWRYTHALTRVQELDKAIDATLDVANGPGEWGFKRELINGIIDYVSQITRLS